MTFIQHTVCSKDSDCCGDFICDNAVLSHESRCRPQPKRQFELSTSTSSQNDQCLTWREECSLLMTDLTCCNGLVCAINPVTNRYVCSYSDYQTDVQSPKRNNELVQEYSSVMKKIKEAAEAVSENIPFTRSNVDPERSISETNTEPLAEHAGDDMKEAIQNEVSVHGTNLKSIEEQDEILDKYLDSIANKENNGGIILDMVPQENGQHEDSAFVPADQIIKPTASQEITINSQTNRFQEQYELEGGKNLYQNFLLNRQSLQQNHANPQIVREINTSSETQIVPSPSMNGEETNFINNKGSLMPPTSTGSEVNSKLRSSPEAGLSISDNNSNGNAGSSIDNDQYVHRFVPLQSAPTRENGAIEISIKSENSSDNNLPSNNDSNGNAMEKIKDGLLIVDISTQQTPQYGNNVIVTTSNQVPPVMEKSNDQNGEIHYFSSRNDIDQDHAKSSDSIDNGSIVTANANTNGMHSFSMDITPKSEFSI